MHADKVGITASSLVGEQVNVDAFVAEAKKLAVEGGLRENDIQFEVEKPFPVDGAILILLGFASKVAYDVWKEFILPELKERYRVRQQESGG
jgi:hypothetical protein